MPLLLSQSDTKRLLTVEIALEATEEAFRLHQKAQIQMPPKVYLFFQKYQGDLRVMPAYLPELDMAGVKIVNVHPGNVEKKKPTVIGTMLLIDPQTGEPIAILDATWITNMRTGAAGGVASKYLARKNSKKLGLVGAGAQAETQLLAIRSLFPLEEVRAYSPSIAKVEEFCKTMNGKHGIDVKPATSMREVCRADILCTTTPSREPIVRAEWIAPGTHINAIGADAPGKQELDPAILQRGTIVIDDWEQASHSGEINVPLSQGLIRKENIYGTLGEIILGKKPSRTSDQQVTIFDSTGLAVQDLVTAHAVFVEAQKQGRGRIVNLFD